MSIFEFLLPFAIPPSTVCIEKRGKKGRQSGKGNGKHSSKGAVFVLTKKLSIIIQRTIS